MKARSLLLQLFVSTLFTIPAQAQSERDGIRQCAAIAAGAERLACFDALTTRLGTAKSGAAAPVNRGQWEVSAATSPLDNSQNVFLSLAANETITGLGGRARPTLIIRCKEGKTDAAVSWDVYLGLDTTTVLTRIDSARATTSLWDISTNNKATFHQRPKQFLRELSGHQVLLAEVVPYGENPAMVTFAIAGVDEAAKPLREACHLKE